MRPITTPAHASARTTYAFGMATIIAGVLAVGAPAVAGTAVTTVVAILLLAGGATRTIFAFKEDTFASGFFMFLFGGLSILAGALMLARPMLGLESLTILLTAYFAADGVVSIVQAFQLRKIKGWGWLLTSGIASLALAWMIASDWPLSGEWAIGVLVGVNLMFAGMTMLFVGAAQDAAAEVVDDELDDAEASVRAAVEPAGESEAAG